MSPEVLLGYQMPWRKEAAELAIKIATEVQARKAENRYAPGRYDRIVFEALLYSAPEYPSEVAQLCLELAQRRDLSPEIAERVAQAKERAREARRSISERQTKKSRLPPPIPRGELREPWPDGPQRRVEHAFQDACLDSGAFSRLAQAAPDAALEVLLAVCIEEPQHEDLFGSSSLPDSLGLSYWHAGEPPAYLRGPFLQFLRQAPHQGLSFVIKLVNFVTRRYAENDVGLDIQIEGRSRRWFGDSNTFRWHFDWPLTHGSQVQSSLMAFEQWLYEQSTRM